MTRLWAWLVASATLMAAFGDAPVEPSMPRPMPPLELGPMRVRAEERADFEAWVDGVAGRIRQHRDGKRSMSAPEFEAAIKSLEAANVDWESFFVEGEKNLEFPQMLYRTEFHELPRYLLHPGNLARKLTGRCSEPARTLPDGGAPNSSFFTNTEIASFTPARIVDEFREAQPRGRLEITKVKQNRTTEGIWVKDETGRKYIVLFDSPFAPEMCTSAEYIGSTLCRIAGFHVPRICITEIHGTGNALYDGRRAVATVALKDFKGEYRYASFRDRREIRGLLIFAAWVSNVDLTEQNTGMTIDANGVCRHYVFDFGASLGSFTFRPQLARLGWTKLFDPVEQFLQPLNNAGIRKTPWEAPYRVQTPAIGYFTANFDPDRWQPFYQNMAFIEVSLNDRRWMAERIGQFSDEQIRAVVDLAGYRAQSDRDYIANTLIRRRDIILERYLAGNSRLK